MSKPITKITDNLYEIESEPGDGTHYSYFIYQNYEDFCIMPCESFFRYPQRLNYFDVRNIPVDEIKNIHEKTLKISESENCNPYTVAEIIRTIKEIYNANTD